MSAERKKPAAQVTVAKKAAALKAAANKAQLSPALIAANEAHIAETALVADTVHRQHDDHHVHGARAPPVRLLDKYDILSITHVTFPTVWAWMRAGTFPRSRVVGGKSMWLSSEVEQWLVDLPVRALKGDADVEAA
jgi:predicted DNA-binding transcriptional regulator AlpA